MNVPFTVGVAGHVDHGKTTLVYTLTGVDTDRNPEEKLRGMSIEAGVAPLLLPSGKRVAVIDVPGHIDFLKNTIRGLNSVELGILVVAADDGVMPQTREHLEILKFFKVASGFAVLSKTDLVDEETLDMAELEIKELVRGTFLDQHPVIRFTSKIPEPADEILKGIDEALAQLPDSKTSFDAHRESLMSLLLEFALTSELTPFSVDTFWRHHQMRYDKEEISQLLNYLFLRKKIVRLNDSRFLSLDALEQIKERVTKTIAQRGFITVHDCKELFGYGRWGGTHVLDYLNRIGFTVRRQDRHYLNSDRHL